MKTYIVQIRESADGRLSFLAEFRARSSAGALFQAARSVMRAALTCVEICATEKD